MAVSLTALLRNGDISKVYAITFCPYYRQHVYDQVHPLAKLAQRAGWFAEVGPVDEVVERKDFADLTEAEYKSCAEWHVFYIHGTHPHRRSPAPCFSSDSDSADDTDKQ